MSIEFLGSKRRLLDFLTQRIGHHAQEGQHFADLFCGTASVAGAFRGLGLRVTANDHLALCSTIAEARLLNDGLPRFEGLLGADEIPADEARHPYLTVLSLLNELPPGDGFVYRNYSPASLQHGAVSRMYFTEENARRIDAIRGRIEDWEPYLSRGERSLLIADLLKAASLCSNTAGTYGCFLKRWKPRALDLLQLAPSSRPSSKGAGHSVFREDAEDLAGSLEADVVYADPPYTKRQYAAYYHVLETIARYDDPELVGKTGLRPWAEESSDFCYRRKAPAALERLVGRIRARHFFLSYNADGQIADEEIREILSDRGKLTVAEVPYQRYRSSRLPHRGPLVTERLYHLALE
ncbi:MAG TPA: DNA adenine methylase [Solirubrobacterales bacterium]|nr:DNA adenine methylase [Solirubrobacterales bacterium]